MKNEVKTGEAVINGEKERFTVEYFVYREEEWGIRVVKLVNGIEKEAASVRNITPLYDKCVSMAEKLLDNTVTPVGLKDALENLICLFC